MKQFKIFMITLVALALAIPAMAAVNVKVKGDWQNYFQYTNNAQFYATGDSKRDSEDDDFLYNARVRLTWIAEDDEKLVRGTLGAEWDVLAGQRAGTRNGAGGNFEGDRTNFELRLAYLDFALPFDKATRVYMGLQSAEMNPWVFCDNAMGVRIARAAGPVDLSLGWFRNDSDAAGGYGGDDKAEYADLVALDAAWTIKDGNKISAFAYFMDDGRAYNGLQSNDSAGDWGGLYALASVTSTFDPSDSVQVYWLGLSGEFEAGPVFGNATAVYQGGTAHTGEAGGEADIKAYMAHAEIGVNIEKFSVRVGGLYMTGDDEADNDVENYFGIDTDNTMLGSVVLFECLDPMTYYAFYGPQAGRYGAMHLYAHFGVELDKNTDLRVGALWLNAAEDIVYIDGSGQKDNNLGYEINAELTHKITKNLTFALAGGYLIAEDGADALASDGDSDDLWKVISMFRFKF